MGVADRTNVEPGEILVGRVGTVGSVNLLRHAAWATDNTVVVSARPGTDARWLAYFLRAASLGATASLTATAQPLLTASVIRDLKVSPISHESQQRIADFLDDRVARIDQIIAARREQVFRVGAVRRRRVADLLLREQNGWLRGPLRRFMRSEDCVRIPLSTEERATRQGEFPYYGASGVIDYVDQFLFEGPRVLLSEDGANLLVRSTPIAFVADGRYWVNNHAHILQPADGAHHFWAARIEAMNVAPWVSGSAQPKLTIDAAMSLPVSAPRDRNDRMALGERVRGIDSDARAAVALLHRQVELLQDYKQSLITAAVTGELDITTASTRIPEQP